MDEPREHYRGTFLPISLMRLYETGTLNGEEVLLLAKIDALQDPKRGGCWASNEYLGTWWRKSVTWVSKTVSRLQELKLIHVTQLGDGARIIKSLLQLEQNFKLPLNKTSTKVPLREGGTTRGAVRPVADSPDTLLPGLGGEAPPPAQFSASVVEFANWSRRHGFHIRVPGANPVYAKGGQKGGWSRLTLVRWEEAYNALCSRHGRDKVVKTMKRFLRWYESEYAPVVHTFTSFAEKFDRIHKFTEKEKAIKDKAGEETDDLDFPDVSVVTINKGPVKTMTEEEHRKLRAEVE